VPDGLHEARGQMLKVLHVPHAGFPFARRLAREGQFGPVNGQKFHDVPVPEAFSFASLSQLPSGTWDAVDAVHIHFGMDFEPPDVIEKALEVVRRRDKPIIFTCHDLDSIHRRHCSGFSRSLDLVLGWSNVVIALTAASAQRLVAERAVPAEKIRVIPHGSLIEADELPRAPLSPLPAPEALQAVIFGAFRANRDFNNAVPSLYFAWARGTSRRLHLVTKPPFWDEPAEAAAGLAVLSLFTPAHPELCLTMKPDYSDQEVTRLLAQEHLLVLPYLSGSHSGQLELAWDLGLVPVATDVGFLRAQHVELGTRHPPPTYFAPISPLDLRGRNLVRAVEEVAMAMPAVNAWRAAHWNDWRQFREAQRRTILDSHAQIYHGH
jgi:hypothetical protein